MTQSLLIDAFTGPGLAGNPAAVVLDEPARDDAWRQRLAADFNLSETAFVRPLAEGRFGLRWFTPKVEVDLCGHATLATTRALREWGLLRDGDAVVFQTRSGDLRCRLSEGVVSMDFPSLAVEAVPEPDGLLRTLGLPDGCPVFKDREDYLVLAPDATTLRALKPDFKTLAQLPCRGVCVTAPSAEAGVDFFSRFFGPRVGVDEDPVTGSAHCRLGPFWGQRLGKREMLGVQCSPRGGRVGIHWDGPEASRLELSGRCVLSGQGEA